MTMFLDSPYPPRTRSPSPLHRRPRYESCTIRECEAIAPTRSKVRLPPCPTSESSIDLLVLEFADCALGRTITVTFVCRDEHRAMNTCMIAHATEKERDAAREEWFATRLKRQMAREDRRREQEKFHKEYWGLPLDDREGDKGKDLLRRAERIGGFPRRHEGQSSKVQDR